MRRNGDLINESRAKPFNRTDRRMVVRIASDDHGVINCPDKRRNGAAALKRITMTTKRLYNLKSNVPGTNANMLGIAHAKIDVAHIRATRVQNPEVIRRHKAARRFAGDDSDETESHLAMRQRVRRS